MFELFLGYLIWSGFVLVFGVVFVEVCECFVVEFFEIFVVDRCVNVV